jgi:hypothetical protein
MKSFKLTDKNKENIIYEMATVGHDISIGSEKYKITVPSESQGKLCFHIMNNDRNIAIDADNLQVLEVIFDNCPQKYNFNKGCFLNPSIEKGLTKFFQGYPARNYIIEKNNEFVKANNWEKFICQWNNENPNNIKNINYKPEWSKKYL